MIYFEILFVLVLGAILNDGPKSPKSSDRRRATYIVSCIALFWLIAAFRSIDWANSQGYDAKMYSLLFSNRRTMSWDTLFVSFVNRYKYNVGDSDIGYDILCKLIGLFTDDYYIFSLLADALFFIPFGYFLFRYTVKIRQIVFASIFYIALIQVYMIAGARQMFALGLDIMAIILIMDGRKALSLAVFVIGVTIHFSSILVLIPILMILFGASIETLKGLHIFSLILYPIVYFFPNEVIVLMGDAIGMERYSQYGMHAVRGGVDTFIILMAMLSVFCLLSLNRNCLERDGFLGKLYSVMPLLTITAPLANSNGSMVRICLYYYIFLVVLLPYGIDKFIDKRQQSIVYGLMIGALAFMIIRGGAMATDYHFMWQSLR